MSRCQQLPWNVLLPRSLKIELHPTDMCKFLLEEKHIYLLKNGRISMAGVSDSNLDYIANSIDEAVRKFAWKVLYNYNLFSPRAVLEALEPVLSIIPGAGVGFSTIILPLHPGGVYRRYRFSMCSGQVASPLLNPWTSLFCSPKPRDSVAWMPLWVSRNLQEMNFLCKIFA